MKQYNKDVLRSFYKRQACGTARKIKYKPLVPTNKNEKFKCNLKKKTE